MTRKEEILKETETIWYSPIFNFPKTVKIILGDMPNQEKYDKAAQLIREKRDNDKRIPDYHRPTYYTPLFSAKQETHMFRKYNYLKHRARKLTETSMGSASAMCKRAMNTRAMLILGNTRLAINFASKQSFESEEFFCNLLMVLLRAVELFDWRKGVKFSTYVTWAFKNEVIKTYRKAKRTTSHERPSDGYIESKARDPGYATERQYEMDQTTIKWLVSKLTKREAYVIQERFCLDGQPKRKSLKELSKELKVSKQRIGQIQKTSLRKLTKLAYRYNAAHEMEMFE